MSAAFTASLGIARSSRYSPNVPWASLAASAVERGSWAAARPGSSAASASRRSETYRSMGDPSLSGERLTSCAMATATCPKCGIPRGAEPQCPACGVIYAKAEAALAERTAREAALAASVMVIPTGISEPPAVDDAALELKFCIAAIPAALLLAVVFHILTPGLQRITLGMPVHELGHATCAWFTGHFAIPTLWKTPVWDRGFVFPVLLFGVFCWMIVSAWRKEKMGLVALGGAFILLQAWGTLAMSAKAADTLIVFGGDGIGMVIATALMAMFFFGKE